MAWANVTEAAPCKAEPRPDDGGDHPVGAQSDGTIFVVDDEYFSRDMMFHMLKAGRFTVLAFESCESFLHVYRPTAGSCLILDVHLPGMGGQELLERLDARTGRLPVIVVSGSSDIPTAVDAMKAGAVDFLQKPLEQGLLLACVTRALGGAREAASQDEKHDAAVDHVAHLTPRQRQIMALIISGQPNKNIAADLGISQRTVETHRASIMHKTGAKSLPALTRMAVSASWTDPDDAKAAQTASAQG